MTRKPVPDFDVSDTLREYDDQAPALRLALELTPPREPVTCDKCHGTGVAHSKLAAYPYECLACDGEGKVFS